MSDSSVLDKHINDDWQQKLSAEIEEKLGVNFVPEDQDGIQRFPAPEKSASNNALWVWISEDRRVAKFGSHITEESFIWRMGPAQKLGDFNVKLQRAENAERQQLSAEKRLEAEKTAAIKAQRIVDKAVPATEWHAYLDMKRVEPYGLLRSGHALLVRLYDIDNNLVSLQFIYHNGAKKFLKGGRIKGAFALIGLPCSTGKLFICEGWATGATLHEKTGHPVVAAMNAGNLLAVCKAFATKLGDAVDIIVVADSDHNTDGNPGLTKAVEAAAAIESGYIWPPVPCAARQCRCSDFNDYYNCSPRTREVTNG